MPLLGNVPVDDAIRLVGVELSRNNQSVVLGTTSAERALLERHSAKGKRRSSLGFLVGGGVMAGLWRWSGNKRRVIGMLATASGGLFGMTYGLLSIRRGLFTELLTLPTDQSPFAARARKVLQDKAPDNAFVKELRERMKNTAGGFDDAWDSTADDTSTFAPLPPAPARSSPPSRDFPPLNEPTDSDGFGSRDGNASRSPFSMFGSRGDNGDGAAAARDRDLPPLSRDPNAAFPPASGGVKHDEDEYFFGVPGGEAERDVPARATSWEEIRRRAAQREQGRK